LVINILNNNKDEYHKDDLDVRLLTKLGFVIIPIGVLGCILFVIFPPDNNNGLYAVIFTSFVILAVNAAWAVIPSMLSSISQPGIFRRIYIPSFHLFYAQLQGTRTCVEYLIRMLEAA
jgi:hypothetical protein